MTLALAIFPRFEANCSYTHKPTRHFILNAGLGPLFPPFPIFFFLGHLSRFGIQASTELGKIQVSLFFLPFPLFPPPTLGRRRFTRLDRRTDRDVEGNEEKKKRKEKKRKKRPTSSVARGLFKVGLSSIYLQFPFPNTEL